MILLLSLKGNVNADISGKNYILIRFVFAFENITTG